MFESVEYSFPASEVEITELDIRNHFGANETNYLDFLGDTVRKITDLIQSEKILLQYRVADFSLTGDTIIIDQSDYAPGKEIINQLKGSQKIFVFACTLHDELVNNMCQFQNYEEILIADAIGTIFIEKTSDRIFELILADPDLRKYKYTNTFSPGNCSWDISDVQRILGHLPGNYLGITVNESGMMSPVKSLCGIVGLGAKVKFRKNTCESCSSKNCFYRKQNVIPDNTMAF